MIRVTIDEAGNRFAHWVALAGRGEEIVVFGQEGPVARLLGCGQEQGDRPKVGTLTSEPVRVAEGCFEEGDSVS